MYSNDDSRNTGQYTSSEVRGHAVREVQSIYFLILADEDDLRDVRSTVADLAGRWQDLGVSMGIRPGDLEAIISASAHSPSDCLRKVLTLWLRQNYKVWTSPIPGLLLAYSEATVGFVTSRGQS